MIGTSFVRTIPMTSTMNLETSSNQENSQISFDLGELVEKPLRNIHVKFFIQFSSKKVVY